MVGAFLFASVAVRFLESAAFFTLYCRVLHEFDDSFAQEHLDNACAAARVDLLHWIGSVDYLDWHRKVQPDVARVEAILFELYLSRVRKRVVAWQPVRLTTDLNARNPGQVFEFCEEQQARRVAMQVRNDSAEELRQARLRVRASLRDVGKYIRTKPRLSWLAHNAAWARLNPHKNYLLRGARSLAFWFRTTGRHLAQTLLLKEAMVFLKRQVPDGRWEGKAAARVRRWLAEFTVELA